MYLLGDYTFNWLKHNKTTHQVTYLVRLTDSLSLPGNLQAIELLNRHHMSDLLVLCLINRGVWLHLLYIFFKF